VKAASFEYYAPNTTEEALMLLERYGDDAKVLAGGQSLMPLLNLRLAQPAVIVDINRIHELDHLGSSPDGALHVGATTRERAVELSPFVRESNPLLGAAVLLIGHVQIRNRGTIGGSIAHADPAGELPAAALALDAEMVIRGKSERTLLANDFFSSYYTTAIEATELLTEVRFPAWPQGRTWAMQEVCRREGDFALVGSIAHFALSDSGTCEDPRVVLFGVGERPVREGRVEEAITGRTLDAKVISEAGAIAAMDVDPDTDLHASATYRREVAGTLVQRVLAAALDRASRDRRGAHSDG
jgi:CO/xanthine dehydrogenase FAD-binding subunit